MRQWFWCSVLFVLACPTASAQGVRTVLVDGRTMQVRIEGLEHSNRSPAIVLETGAGGFPFDAWAPIMADLAQNATVVAYDRAGFGGSEADGELPTPRHNVDMLRRLLARLALEPPYVLVGHSWGGPLIRMFAALHPTEVAGLVYIDPTDLRTQEQETTYLLSTGFTRETAAQHLTGYWQDWARYLATLPPAARIEMQVIEQIERSGAPEFRQLPPVRDVPVSVILAGRIVPGMWLNRPCDPQACFDRWLDYRREWLAPLTAGARPGTVALDPASGHDIPRDNPAIVVEHVRRVH